MLAEGRADGLEDAIEIIDAYYINSDSRDNLEALFSLSPREFEILISNLYRMMGYKVLLTAPQRDGGRDIVAERSKLGEKQRVLIECKQYSGTVKVDIARALLGVVATERANGGILVTTGRCSKGVRDLAKSDDRLDFVDGDKLGLLLNQHFGTEWRRRLVRLSTHNPRSNLSADELSGGQ
ncbi:restriction endonuclease [Nocardia aurantiaca]|nr:restriction endonuclease [Nocardia aurantiaca]